MKHLLIATHPMSSRRLACLSAALAALATTLSATASAQTGTVAPNVCGKAFGQSFLTAPFEPPVGNLCSSGTPMPNPAVFNPASGTFDWVCVIPATAAHPAQKISCRAKATKKNGQCGPANHTTGLTSPPSGAALCASGATATQVVASVSVTGVTSYSWSCPGSNGGAAASCQATGTGKGTGTAIDLPPTK